MNLTSITELKSLLQKHGAKPNKRFGQNFLINKNVLQKLIAAAEINKDDTVLEVGSGVGTITVELAKRAKKVIAVEKDKNLVPILKETAQNLKNVEILKDDILKFSIYEIQNTKYKVIGNIPYYITAPLIRKFLEMDSPPKSMTLMVQKEMAQRICASPPNMSILAVSVQVYATPAIISYVPRSSFWPQPDVDSAILRISQIHVDMKTDLPGFFRIVRAGFSSPRKQLANNLSRILKIDMEKTKKWLKDAGIDPKRRAETLSVKEWLLLANMHHR